MNRLTNTMSNEKSVSRSEKQITARIRVDLDASKALPAPSGANYFRLTHSGGEVQMLVGTVDLERLSQASLAAVAGNEQQSISPDISHRFLLSALGFDQLHQVVTELYESMKKAER